MLIQVILLTSCTIVYLVQMEYGGVISFNWYWMAYTALVLIEMQTFGLQIRQVMNEKLTCLLTDVRSGGGGGGVGSGSPSSCSSGRSSHGLQYSLWASSSSHNNNNNNNPATHNNNTNNYLSNYRRNRRQAAAAVHEQSLIMATPPRNNNKLTSPPPPPTTPPPVFSLLV